MAGEPPRRAPFGSASHAPALSGLESLGQTLSPWLQLMLAEISAKRDALERARAEEAQRRTERAAPPADSPRDAPRS